MFKKILVPYDKSEPARNALAQALELVGDNPDAEVTVLNVIDWQDYNAETFKIASRMSGVLGDSLDMNAIADVGEETAKKMSDVVASDIAGIVGDSSVVNIVIVNGSAHDTITAYASEGEYECIVMGHRGLGLVRGMLGSVCYSVLNKTSVPVLIVK